MVRPGQWTVAPVVDAAITVVPGEDLKRRGRLQAYLGSGEHRVWFRMLDDDAGLARLRLEQPLPLAPGDRFVLRDPGSRRTVAGGEVLDVDPAAKAKDAPARLVLDPGDRLLAGHPWLPLADLPRLSGWPTPRRGSWPATSSPGDGRRVVDRWLTTPETLDSLRTRAANGCSRTTATIPSSRGSIS